MPNLISLTCSNIGQIPDGYISNFSISGQSFIKENYHNSRTSDDIDMKLGLVTKLDKKNKTPSKNFDDKVLLESYDIFVSFPVHCQFGAIRKPDSAGIVCKAYVFITCNLLSYKNWGQN